jgi:hypothetical protein
MMTTTRRAHNPATATAQMRLSELLVRLPLLVWRQLPYAPMTIEGRDPDDDAGPSLALLTLRELRPAINYDHYLEVWEMALLGRPKGRTVRVSPEHDLADVVRCGIVHDLCELTNHEHALHLLALVDFNAAI